MMEKLKEERHLSPKLLIAARDHRKRSTLAESALWERLRSRRLKGLKFRRQQPIGRFIVDFFCPSAKLIVEVDGPIHLDQQEKDQERQREIEAAGYRVIRVTNEDIETNLEAVLANLAQAASPLLHKDGEGAGG